MKKPSKTNILNVSVLSVQPQQIPLYLHALGTVTPYSSIQVQAQVTGTLTRYPFKEGSIVRKGDVIAIIDDQQYKAIVDEYFGQYQRDLAALQTARTDLARYEKLFNKAAISEQILATQQQLVKQLEGSVVADLGALDKARIDFERCTIKAPVDGQLGLHTIDEGNLITTANNTLFKLNTLQPVFVMFSVPDYDLPKIQPHLNDKNNFSIQVLDRAKTNLLDESKDFFLDNQIDTLTGTVKIKAQCLNTQSNLFPNQFVNVRVLFDIKSNALVVPLSALVRERHQTSLYVLNTDTLTVKKVAVKTGVTIEESIIINEGIFPGDSVITAGAEKLRDGSSVIVLKART